MNALRDFTHRFLPWVLGAIVLLLYIVTLNGWVTLPTLTLTSQLKGWDLRAVYSQPVHYLLTWPIRLLPGTAEILGLNIFSALCGALTIALLARSVSLLPQDRTRDQRQRETSELSLLSMPLKWVPPVFAGLLLALQSTFWENATAPSSEMLDLLIFAYAIRCLLEFRVTQNENWLTRLALTYGLGITNNWAMIGFFPLFLVALVWIKGLSFFNGRFMIRMIAFGLMGLSLYLLLPIIHLFSGQSDLGFFEALRENWRYQKNFIFILPFISAPLLRLHLFMLSLTSIIPLLLIGIRWRSFRGDTSASGGIITGIMFRLMHIALLCVCAWVFFDPKISGRLLGFGMLPFLTFYFLSALSAGYFMGYVLLVFGVPSDRKWENTGTFLSLTYKALVGVVLLGAVAVPAGLIHKNWASIRATNSSLLPTFAGRLIQHLPADKSVLLADDPLFLSLVQAATEKAGKTNPHILIATANIGEPAYRSLLQRRYPELNQVFKDAEGAALGDAEKVILLMRLRENFPVYYLQPSFGYYFEAFYSVPRGLIYELEPYRKDELQAPALSNGSAAFNEKFWDEVSATDVNKHFQDKEAASGQALWVGAAYSRAINHWAVQLQKQNRLKEADSRYAIALQFNPENMIAHINKQFNAQLQSGKVEGVRVDAQTEKRLAQFGTLVNAMNVNGPFDELNANLTVGEAFGFGGNLRQALQYFSRVLELAPQEVRASIGLALTYLDLGQHEKALAQVQKIRSSPKIVLDEQQKYQLLRTEVLSLLSRKEISAAKEILDNASKDLSRNEAFFKLMQEFHLQAAVMRMNDKAYPAALEHLNTLHKMDANNPHALFNRALVYLNMDRLDAAKMDFEKAEEILPERSHRVHYGLAEIAVRQKNTPEALKQYEIYLQVAPRNTTEYKQVEAKVKELRGSATN